MSKVLICVSLIFIAHACFSAYEFVSGSKRATNLHSSASIPVDIVVELLAASIAFVVGAVLNANQTPLKVVHRHSFMKDSTFSENNRLGFVDIVKRRREFALKSGQGGPTNQ